LKIIEDHKIRCSFIKFIKDNFSHSFCLNDRIKIRIEKLFFSGFLLLDTKMITLNDEINSMYKKFSVHISIAESTESTESTESIDSVEFTDSIEKLKQSVYNEYIEIFFELLYSTIVMRNYLMIMHNDLHFNNIFVEKIDTPYLYEYTFLGITKMKKYKVLLYDNDNA